MYIRPAPRHTPRRENRSPHRAAARQDDTRREDWADAGAEPRHHGRIRCPGEMEAQRSNARHHHQEIQGGLHPQCTGHTRGHHCTMAILDQPDTTEINAVHRHPRCLRTRPQPRRDLHAGRNAVSTAHQPGGLVQHRAGQKRSRDYRIREPRRQLPLGLQPRGRPGTRPAMAPHLGELRRGCHRQCKDGGGTNQGLSGRRP